MCFICGTQNPHGMGITWYATPDGSVTGCITLTEHQQGPPGYAHGGASAALLDEAMGAAVWVAGHRVLAKTLNVTFHRPLPLGVEVRIQGRITNVDGRTITTEGTITLPDGAVTVSAQGTYKEAAHIFTNSDFLRIPHKRDEGGSAES
ncbi:MAG: hypothetical protein Kow00124_20110 [Anaerolineae bacterium]